jgi:hypothetical protein
MKKIKVQMLLYTLTENFMEVQKYMLNPFVSYCFTKWWGGLMAKTLVWNQGDQGLVPLSQHILCGICIVCIYILYMCVDV